MKSILPKIILFYGVSLLWACSGEDDFNPNDIKKSPLPEIDVPSENTNYKIIPWESLSDIGAAEIIGLPKLLIKYDNGELVFWRQFYYRSDGNLLKVRISYPKTSSEIFTDDYVYDENNKLTKILGIYMFNFYWTENQITKVEMNNAGLGGRTDITFKYNEVGLISERLETYLDFIGPSTIKNQYAYYDDGNLKSDEFFVSMSSGMFQPLNSTKYDEYNGNTERFLELQLIPGQSSSFMFPSVITNTSFADPGYVLDELFTYKLDAEGRVIEKIDKNFTTVYEYY